MTDRRLVGMTMSARKRAARRDAVTAKESGIYTDNGAEHPALLRWYMLAVFFANVVDDEETKRRYAEARARYRIGERLRPCHGCEECCGYDMNMAARKRAAWRKAIEKCGGTDDMDLVRGWYAEYREEYRDEYCDGSGVLPAKRGRVRAWRTS